MRICVLGHRRCNTKNNCGQNYQGDSFRLVHLKSPSFFNSFWIWQLSLLNRQDNSNIDKMGKQV